MKLDNDWTSVFSMNDSWEFRYLDKRCKDLYEKKGSDLSICEVGSYHGQSTTLLANWGEVLAIDLFADLHDGLLNYDKIGQGHFVDFIKTMIRFNLIDRVSPVIATSDYLNRLPNMEFDLIFIDASHKYEETKKDINNCFRHLKSDGLLMVHDYKRNGYGYPPCDSNHPHHTLKHDPWWGVGKAVDEFVALGEFGISEHYYGMVCLQRVDFIKEVIRVPKELSVWKLEEWT